MENPLVGLSIYPDQKEKNLQDCRLAERGEFTKRAFLNVRLDLTQAESVMDIISSKTEKSMSLSMDQLQGRLSKQVNEIVDELMEL
ncbi:MAG: hypothetical protein H0S78_13280, partial [Tissierellales bacterium]|nr:hypothetical protein [Tissierellales bacterium]